MTIQLSPPQLHQYNDQGYTLVRGLVPRSVIDGARTRVMEVVRGAHEWQEGHFQILDPRRYTWPDGSTMPAGVQRPAQCEKVFDDVARHANLQSAMSQLLGGEVELFTDQIGVKYAMIKEEQGGCSFYHQDSYYWHIDPRLGCNCWIPMDDVDRGAIALAVMPGSQRNWELLEHEHYFDDPPMCGGADGQPFKRHRIPPDRIDFSGEVVIPMRAGDGLFFTNYTWHRSEPNRSGKDKCFYAIAYQCTSVKAEIK